VTGTVVAAVIENDPKRERHVLFSFARSNPTMSGSKMRSRRTLARAGAIDKEPAEGHTPSIGLPLIVELALESVDASF